MSSRLENYPQSIPEKNTFVTPKRAKASQKSTLTTRTYHYTHQKSTIIPTKSLPIYPQKTTNIPTKVNHYTPKSLPLYPLKSTRTLNVYLTFNQTVATFPAVKRFSRIFVIVSSIGLFEAPLTFQTFAANSSSYLQETFSQRQLRWTWILHSLTYVL